MERKTKLALVLLAVLVAAAIFYVLQPKIHEWQIKRLLDEANYCAVDGDCAVLNTTVGCPFGCYHLGNKNADVTQINSLWGTYQKNLNSPCVYSCIISPTPEEIKCVNKKCVDARFGN